MVENIAMTPRLSTSHLLTFIALLFFSSHTLAATFTVTNTNDSGAGSLRQAITSANANPMDADNIVFNIPTSDPNYNASMGVFTITVTSLLPTVNSISVSIDGTTQPGNTNPNGPEICLKSNSNLMYGLGLPFSGGSIKGLIINGFLYGVAITKYQTYPSGSCTVSDCYIGVNHDGTIAAPNDIGIAVMEASNNIFKNNIISGNSTAGIALRKSNTNTIQGNKIGTERTGMSALPNYYGVAIDSSSTNTIGGTQAIHRNIISGNSYAGVAINTPLSHGNVIKGNYIGINVNGMLRTDTVSNYYGVAINDSPDNIIGGSTPAERNIISGNRDGGIAMLGPDSKNNVVHGNYIGTNVTGTDSIPNTNGITLSGVSETQIGGSATGQGNVISGNTLAGIVMAYSGTRLNTIKGNMIGTDHLGTVALSNHTGIYIKSNANSNTVGGTTADERNIISANYEMGLMVEAADSNLIIGNYIGPDVTGLSTFRLSNDTLVQGNGLMFNSNSKRNIAGGYSTGERNVISGNRVYGHDIYGNSSYNLTIGNYIGVDATGNNPMPNATGICVDGGSHHNPFINNVLSGNLAYGMFIVTTGSDYNEVKGNMIGTNAAGTDTVPNQMGLLLGGGTKNNTIGGTGVADRNIISGNRFAGVEVADHYTSYNNIIGNYIGTDVSGTYALPNLNGIGFATYPSKNNIEGNVISGNDYLGIILYENCDSNTVFSNKIGMSATNAPLPNLGAGIVLVQGSQHNQIGMPNKGNEIAYNDSAGIVVKGATTTFNTFSANHVFSNGLMDIDLYPFGVTVNDAGDGDVGANELMNYPVIETSTYYWVTGETTVTGTMDCNAYGGPAGVRIEVFKTNDANLFGHGGATQYLGETVITDPSGNWSLVCTGVAGGERLTATATDVQGNTSELALNSSLVVGMEEAVVTQELSIYPNPANDHVQIYFANESEQQLTINLYAATGQLVKQLEQGTYAAGSHVVQYDLTSYPTGMYLLGISDEDGTERMNKLVIAH